MNPKDDKEALEFCRSIFIEMGWPLDKLGDSIEELFGGEGDSFIMMKDEWDNVIGTAGLIKLWDSIALVKRFYLAKHVRGSGRAKLLFDNLVKCAREEGYKILVLDVQKTNTRAIRFYEKMGFKELAFVVQHPRWEGSSLERQKTDRYFLFDLNKADTEVPAS